MFGHVLLIERGRQRRSKAAKRRNGFVVRGLPRTESGPHAAHGASGWQAKDVPSSQDLCLPCEPFACILKASGEVGGVAVEIEGSLFTTSLWGGTQKWILTPCGIEKQTQQGCCCKFEETLFLEEDP